MFADEMINPIDTSFQDAEVPVGTSHAEHGVADLQSCQRFFIIPKIYSKRGRWSRNREVPLGMMWRWTSGETRANVSRETASPRALSPSIRTPIWTAFHELSQLPQLHPDRVLMRRRDAGVEADAREWADLAFGVAKNPIARVSILARFSGPSRGRFRHGHNLYLMAMPWQSFSRPKPPRTGASHRAEAVSRITPGGSHTDP